MRGGANVKVWIDIDNPAQVQYLVPFEAAFRKRSVDVVLTARDYGNTVELLRQRSVSYQTVGKEFGGSKIAKVMGSLRRGRALAALLRGDSSPDVLLCASRSAALAARRLRITSFVILDYEYVNSSFFRLTRSVILYPQVIDPAPFLASGLHRDQLIAFRGLKEDISMAGVDTAKIAPHYFPEIQDDTLVRVLFRPPSEMTHYYAPQSRELALRTLEHLAAKPEVVVVFLPRHEWQRGDLTNFPWHNAPVVLERAVPFISLLKAVDLVVAGGGTMLREAAYLGIPAYSILKSPIGGVDRHLASIGRVRLIDSADELSVIELRKAPSLSPLASNGSLLDELVALVLGRTSRLQRRPSQGAPETTERPRGTICKRTFEWNQRRD